MLRCVPGATTDADRGTRYRRRHVQRPTCRAHAPRAGPGPHRRVRPPSGPDRGSTPADRRRPGPATGDRRARWLLASGVRPPAHRATGDRAGRARPPGGAGRVPTHRAAGRRLAGNPDRRPDRGVRAAPAGSRGVPRRGGGRPAGPHRSLGWRAAGAVRRRHHAHRGRRCPRPGSSGEPGRGVSAGPRHRRGGCTTRRRTG